MATITRRPLKWFILGGIFLALLGALVAIEGPPRLALWQAGFSHRTYWIEWPSQTRKDIECSDF